MTNISDRYIATIILYSLGDTIGFNNGIWANRYNKKIITLEVIHEILYEFIDLGGINGINLNGWSISVNTLMHIATAYSIIDGSDDIIPKTIKLYKKVIHTVYHDQIANIPRGLKEKLKKKLIDINQNKISSQYDPDSSDNACSTRMLCVGLYYREDQDKLIQVSMENSLLTNTSPIGYLGGITSALFTSYAINDIDITRWPTLLMEVLESDIIKKKYVKTKEEEDDYDVFVMNWRKYMELKFNGDVPLKIKSNVNILYRSKFYYDNFTSDRTSPMIGYSGYSSVIMAYDCLLDSRMNWEKLIIYAALNFGDTYSVSSIACGWYGAMYGFGDVPSKNLENLEYKDELYKVGKMLYKK